MTEMDPQPQKPMGQLENYKICQERMIYKHIFDFLMGSIRICFI